MKSKTFWKTKHYIRDKIIKFKTVSTFLTMRCTHHCSYCIQGSTKRNNYPEITGSEWIKILTKPEFKQPHRFLKPVISIIGGEPTLHKDFDMIIDYMQHTHKILITTNLNSLYFNNIKNIIEKYNKSKNIFWVASYHPEQMPIKTFLNKFNEMKKGNLNISARCVDYCLNPEIKQKLKNINTIFQVPQGIIDGELHPIMAYMKRHDVGSTGIFNYDDYKQACGQEHTQTKNCKINEIILNPQGKLCKCHYLLYHNIEIKEGSLCPYYGHCNPCDYTTMKRSE